VTDYLAGALPDDDGARFESHLGECSGCRNYLEQMRETIRLTGMLSEESIPAQGREELLRAFRSWRSSP
jgi:predicted anti-sigma-YlaC factor YlaD